MRRLVLVVTLSIALWPIVAAAQDPAPAGAQAPAGRNPLLDPDRPFNPQQPDFTLINLPTTLRMPLFRSSFRVTHRFGRPLGAGDFGDLASDFFGLDNGAQIGLEYRFGIARGVYTGVTRTSDKTIAFSAIGSLLQQRNAAPVGVSVTVGVDGSDNFSEEFSPSVGFLVSREFEGIGAVYLQPIWVGNVNIFEPVLVADDNTMLLGVGGRLRIRPTVYVLAEYVPRLTGYDLGVNLATVAIEKRAGGHSFQFNFSNGLGTTMSQLARGGTANEDWYIGFNISRKFF